MSHLRRNLLFIVHTFVWVAALGLLLVAPYRLVEAKQPAQTGADYRFQAQRSQLNQEQYRTRDVELGDFDADGDLDVLLVNETEHPLVLFRNEGGSYREVAELNPGNSLLAANAAWGDADGDGDLDLAVAVRNGPVAHLIFENQNGTLSDTPLKLFESPDGTIDGQSVAWGDFNGDGLLDLVFANGTNAPSDDTSPVRHTHQNYVYENKSVPGQLDFELTFEDQQEVPSYGLTIADLDGDDDLDIVVANGAGNEVPFNNFIYVNNHDGNGNSPISFTVVSVEAIVAATENIPEPAPQTSLSVAHADFNRDGKPDIVFGNYRSPDLILCNATPFPAPGEPTQPLQLQTCFSTDEGHGLPGLEGSATTGVAIADMDGDMNLDLALSLQNQSSLILCGTQGGGSNLSFEICWESQALGTNLTSADVAIGDLNSDGRLDLVLGNGGYQFIDQPSYVYHSLQIVFRD
ncbi:MAG: VCBS repeat-containing protein, partial [Anaerolineales bacterium]|nr:VCBS repeat-containing protein [Anaerolineales bacterium]